jgi:hypothetical protein
MQQLPADFEASILNGCQNSISALEHDLFSPEIKKQDLKNCSSLQLLTSAALANKSNADDDSKQ